MRHQRKLTQHFTLAEFTTSQVAIRQGILNEPSEKTIERLKEVATWLEEARTLLGFPIFISSGFRSPRVNHLVGGAANSAHMDGYAADITCFSFGRPYVVAKALVSIGKFDQLILEYGRWVHVSVNPHMRGEVLTATGKGYLKGLHDV
jgi:zinc D-Ala-D-Ala carboxypeptidase